MSSPTLIDDASPIVQYQSGWNLAAAWPEVDRTRHWVSTPEVSASLVFTGTGIQVVGTIEPTDQNDGQPTTQYSIDGAVVTTYTAPFTTGSPSYNVTFFSIDGLSLEGSHEIVITNMDAPTFFLDYFLVHLDSPSSASPTTSSPLFLSTTSTTSLSLSSTVVSTHSSTSASTTSASTTTTSSSSSSRISTTQSSSTKPSSSASTALPLSYSTGTSSSSTSGSPTTTTFSNISHSSGHSSTGVIVGGVIGGVTLIVLLAISFAICKRNQRRVSGVIEPFGLGRTMSSASSGSLLVQGSAEMVARSPAFVRPPAAAFRSSSDVSEYSITQSEQGGAEEHTGFSMLRSPPQQGLYPASDWEKLPEPANDLFLASPSANSPDARASAPDHSHADIPTPTSLSAIFSPVASLLRHADSEASSTPWYAPPQGLLQGRYILRALSQGCREDDSGSGRGVDSGLRMYNEPALPPPYTAD